MRECSEVSLQSVTSLLTYIDHNLGPPFSPTTKLTFLAAGGAGSSGESKRVPLPPPSGASALLESTAPSTGPHAAEPSPSTGPAAEPIAPPAKGQNGGSKALIGPAPPPSAGSDGGGEAFIGPAPPPARAMQSREDGGGAGEQHGAASVPLPSPAAAGASMGYVKGARCVYVCSGKGGRGMHR
jgi:hypothetical protein